MASNSTLATFSRRRTARKTIPLAATDFELFCFETGFGWIGVRHQDHLIHKVAFGYPTERRLLAQFEAPPGLQPASRLTLFQHELKTRFSDYVQGQSVAFDDLEIEQSWMTPFQKKRHSGMP